MGKRGARCPWKFSERTDHAATAEQVVRELTGELMALRQWCMDTREVIAKWKAAAEKPKPSRRRKAQPLQNEGFRF